MKFEKVWPNQTLVTDGTRLNMTDRWMDERMDGQTNRCKAIYPLFFEREQNNVETDTKDHTISHLYP